MGDTFDDGNVHYLHTKIDDNKTDIYLKNMHKGQFKHFSSYAPWRIKKSMDKSITLASCKNLYH